LDIAVAYGTFVVIPLMLVAFIGKWVLLGRVTEGDLPKEITVYLVEWAIAVHGMYESL
jgi:hypothetical protein